MHIKFAMVIIDEARRLGAPSTVQWRKTVSSLQNDPAIICLSATPSRFKEAERLCNSNYGLPVAFSLGVRARGRV